MRKGTKSRNMSPLRTMSDGTSLEDLETGNVSEQADAARMAEILNDINAPSTQPMMPPMGSMPGMPQAGPMRQMPPMAPMYNPNPPTVQYVPIDEEVPKKKKGNIWSSVLEHIQDPLIVAVLIFALSFPALHTQFAKYASWAYGVGGQLSWLGLVAISFLGAVVFGLYRAARDLFA